MYWLSHAQKQFLKKKCYPTLSNGTNSWSECSHAEGKEWGNVVLFLKIREHIFIVS